MPVNDKGSRQLKVFIVFAVCDLEPRSDIIERLVSR